MESRPHLLHSPDGRLRPALRAIIGLVMALFGMIVFAFAFGASAMVLSLFLHVDEVVVIAISYAGQGFGAIAAVIAARRLLDRRPARDLGLRWSRLSMLDLCVGMALGAGLQFVIFAVHLGLGWARIIPIPAMARSALWPGLTAVFALLILVAVNEELLSRGYLLQNLTEAFGVLPAVLISSLVFGAMHLMNAHSGWMAAANITVTGIFLAVGYLATRSLYLPIGIHLAWNFFEGSVFGFPVSGFSGFPSLLHLRISGPTLWTGGPFGPEAGLTGLLACIIGALLIPAWGYWRRRLERP